MTKNRLQLFVFCLVILQLFGGLENNRLYLEQTQRKSIGAIFVQQTPIIWCGNLNVVTPIIWCNNLNVVHINANPIPSNLRTTQVEIDIYYFVRDLVPVKKIDHIIHLSTSAQIADTFAKAILVLKLERDVKLSH